MNDIISNLNYVLNKVYLSIKNEGYTILEKISDIDIEIFSRKPLNLICLNENREIIILIINTIVFAFLLYYAFKMILQLYDNNLVTNIYYFLIKVIIIVIISNNSYNLCKEVVKINSLATDIVNVFLEDISKSKITYECFSDNINTLDKFFKMEDKINVNGLSESIICIFILSMLMIFSIRYVVIILCVITSPFCFLTLLSSETKHIFKMWLKIFIYNLSAQIVNKFILFIPIVSKEENEFSQVIMIGSILVIYKINKYIERCGGIWKE